MAAVGTMSYPARDSYQTYTQQYAHYSSRAQQAPAVTTSSLAGSSYPSYTSAPQQQHQPQQHQTYPPSNRSARSSHSPSSDDGQKPSLPSISNLFGMVDGERSSQEHAAKNAQSNHNEPAQVQPQQPQTYASQPPTQPQHVQSQQHQHPMQQVHVRQQPQFQHPMHSQSQHASNATRPEQVARMTSHPPLDASSQRAMIPPTPPMRSDSIGETTHSPSTISTGSSLSGQPYFVGSALNNVEADQQRAIIPQLHKRPSVAHMHPQTSPYNASPYATSAYSASPGAMSSTSFYSPNQAGYPVGGIYAQRALPSSFPPQPHPPPTMPATNPWEHHHYIGPSSHSTYPQTQERYICPTCNKAFSRPSSLKIHSHSHTGEKPFKCPHSGCGKAFSVRSNMKRHERGCHTGGGSMLGSSPHMTQ